MYYDPIVWNVVDKTIPKQIVINWSTLIVMAGKYGAGENFNPG